MANATGNVKPDANGVSTNDLKLDLTESYNKMLIDLVMYQNKDMVALFGIVAVQKEVNKLASEFISKMIEQRFNAVKQQLKDRRTKKNTELFRDLISRGYTAAEAYKIAYGEEAL